MGDGQDSPECSWTSAYVAARIAAGHNDPAEMERCLVRADEIARRYELQGACAVARLRHPVLAMAQGRFDEAEQALGTAVAELRARGAVDLSGLAALSVGCIRLQQGRLAEMLPVLLAVWEQSSRTAKPSPRSRCWPAAAAKRPGRSSASACGCGATSPSPSWPGCAAAIVLRDGEAAVELYEDLLPLQGLAGGASSLSLVFRPVAQTPGELARFLDRPERARRHYLEAARVAAAWDSPLWADAAQTGLAGLPPAPALVLPAVPRISRPRQSSQLTCSTVSLCCLGSSSLSPARRIRVPALLISFASLSVLLIHDDTFLDMLPPSWRGSMLRSTSNPAPMPYPSPPQL
ncbi:hypothetical protein OG816_01885 [Streptomyces sp. NBC_00073]|nr:hypothetical protein [Streptomyces sp. NBC_01278]